MRLTVTCPGSDQSWFGTAPMGPMERLYGAGWWPRVHVDCPGADPVLIRHGADGADGEGCPEAGGEGFTVTCPGSEPVLIRHGADGEGCRRRGVHRRGRWSWLAGELPWRTSSVYSSWR